MKIATTAAVVLTRYPAAARAIQAKLGTLVDVTLALEWSLRIGDRFGGEVTAERVRDHIQPRVFWGVTGSVGRRSSQWSGIASGASVPDEIVALYVAQYAREQAEQQRVDAMTPAQRQARTQEILARLRRRGAFAEIPLHRDPRTWTAEADAALLAAWEAGTPASEIGRKLNVSHADVLVRARQIAAQWNSANAPEMEGIDSSQSSKPAL